MLPLGSVLSNFNISFHSKLHDTQIYFQLKYNHSFSRKPLFDCRTYVKAWMASNFQNFYKNKTEVIIFGPSGNCRVCSPDLEIAFSYL